MIRKATMDDLERLVEMGMRFAADADYRDLIAVKPENIADAIFNVVNSPDGVVFVSGSDATVTGMIAILAYDHPFSGELDGV